MIEKPRWLLTVALAGKRFALPDDVTVDGPGIITGVIGVHHPNMVAGIDAPDTIQAKPRHIAVVAHGSAPVDDGSLFALGVHADLDFGVVGECAE